MNIILDHVINVSDVVVLETAPSKRHKYYEILITLVGDKFKLIGEDIYRHLNTGKDYILSAYNFISSTRFLWEGKRTDDSLAKVLVLRRNVLAVNPILKGKKTPIKAGTICTKFRTSGSYHYIETNNGTELRFHITAVNLMVDTLAPTTSLCKAVVAPEANNQLTIPLTPSKPLELNTEATESNIDVVPEDFEVVQSYKVKGLDMSFNSKEEADFAVSILKSRDKYLSSL